MDTPDNETGAEPGDNHAADGSGGLLQSIGKNALMLGAFALLCTGFIAATYVGTSEKIAEQQRQAKLRALYEIIPVANHDNDLLADNIAFQEASLGHRKPQRLYLAMQNNKPAALIYPGTARDGYSGDIRFIVGIKLVDNSVAGVRVLEHRETPGLGDAIEIRKSNWINGFVGRKLGAPPLAQWTVKKDGGVFDAFTGATITPRALVKSVASVLQYHEQQGAELARKMLQDQKLNGQ
ncbi:MAG: electron transport complex subunit RsxG [Gammaproteobacteria bacterium]|nr:electron transport complex subunit RsxG [Gammaproteobacteria bacterium]NND39496.1 electron transport complex subunit RsxG [Pseudomonadales bacterium]NNL10800.1 electron transport complex subunit RsxG [Pseudomonadales bacterium]NNM10703.1 electron transport complex subunit RsxG [Pseudomonadales bacterium]